jgi:hypothetical protein
MKVIAQMFLPTIKKTYVLSDNMSSPAIHTFQDRTLSFYRSYKTENWTTYNQGKLRHHSLRSGQRVTHLRRMRLEADMKSSAKSKE